MVGELPRNLCLFLILVEGVGDDLGVSSRGRCLILFVTGRVVLASSGLQMSAASPIIVSFFSAGLERGLSSSSSSESIVWSRGVNFSAERLAIKRSGDIGDVDSLDPTLGDEAPDDNPPTQVVALALSSLKLSLFLSSLP